MTVHWLYTETTFAAGSRLYDESLLADEMWLREDGTLLSYTDFKEVVVQLRPRRKKRNEPKKEENDPFADIKGKQFVGNVTTL